MTTAITISNKMRESSLNQLLSRNDILDIYIGSERDTVGPRFTGPRYTGTPIYREDKVPRYRKLTVFRPDKPGTPIYRAKSFPPRIPVNRGPTVGRYYSHSSSQNKIS
eukprot:sb/3477519/